ncbi:AraC family transcriptional regulator [Methylibium sp. Pch-M]|uniref:AraC-like ligand-binding domain-containing protein n=1 Tax=Methylibium sp. Pch-M TaxID=2082386 RepID=UPI001010953B|nr:helix-turn-helix domain-containing protein [Methylibium sp. Pch-M]QAZ40582.1 AraC family transcriptional regulator [Methylibium sp. Pch-M]
MRIWTTESQPQHLQFSYWREVLCEAFVSLDPVRQRMGPGFTGEVCSSPLGRTMQTRVASGAQFLNRRTEEIRRNPVEFIFVNFQLEGSCVVRQDGRESLVQSGDFSIVDTTRPYFLDFRDDWRVLSFRVPITQFLAKLAAPRDATARCLSGAHGAGLVATRFAHSLQDLDDDLSEISQESLGAALNCVVTATLGSMPETREQDRSSLRLATRSAVEGYIADHLADPSLSPHTIAARFRMSRRSLYSLFEASPLSVSGMIRTLRLERSAQDLLRPNRPSILDVALRWGFNDLSHYSRIFRRRFGASPREFIAASRKPGS